MPQQLTDWLTTITLGQALTWTTLITTAALAVWKGWPVFRRVVAGLSKAVSLVDTLATLDVDLAFIKHELDDNNGGSVKDAVKRTEKAVAVLTEQVSGISGDVGHMKRQVASLKTSVAKTNRKLADRTPAAAEKGNEIQ